MSLISWRLIELTMCICSLENFGFGCWILSLIIVWQGHDNVLRLQTSILKSFVIYWTSSLPGFTRRGRRQTTSCKVEKSMNVLPPCYDAFVVRILGTFIIDELVLFSIYRIMLLICCLKSWIVFLTGAWRVFLGLLTLGRVETVWSKKEFSGDNARWIFDGYRIIR